MPAGMVIDLIAYPHGVAVMSGQMNQKLLILGNYVVVSIMVY